MLTGIPFVDAHGALRPGQLVEVCGVGGSGKTEILMQAAVCGVMPRERRGVRFGGCESGVLLLDLDGKFDTLRLLTILNARVNEALRSAALAPEDARRLRDEVYVECVARFQTLRCHSSFDFLKALAVVERAFEAKERQQAGNQPDPGKDARGEKKTPRRLLLVDNVAAFYWTDRASRRESGAPLSLHAVHHASAAKLRDISRACRAPVIVTKGMVSAQPHGFRNRRDGDDGGGGGGCGGASLREPEGAVAPHRDFLPPTWSDVVTQRLVLDVERVPPRGGGGGGGGGGGENRRLETRGFEGAGGYGVSFVARWDFPSGRPGARYDIDGDEGIKCR